MITHNSVITHCHKKQKESLEARAEVAVLRTYVENQAILEPTLVYQASKCKQTKEQGGEDCLSIMDSYFYLFI